jgi:endonuclease YncB( thermonuclease family)
MVCVTAILVRMRSHRALLLLLLCMLVTAMATASPAAAGRTGPCYHGYTGRPCHFQTGTMTGLNDGDTIYVDLDGDSTHRAVTVRSRSLNTLELTRYTDKRRLRRGECGAVASTNLTEALIRAGHNRVRLSAQHPLTGPDGRLRRWVAFRRHGHWVDLGSELMRSGHAMLMQVDDDYAFNLRYNELEQQAVLAQRGMWNPLQCKPGPQQAVPIRLWADWEPTGNDTADHEWVKIQNQSPAETLHLGGWRIRNGPPGIRFTFPSGYRLAPGATATVEIGHAPAGSGAFSWGLPKPILGNPTGAPVNRADNVLLFDPDGDVRAHLIWPCVVACTDPNQGAFELDVYPRNPEHLTVINRSDRAINLDGYALYTRGALYPFGPDSTLWPGQQITVYVRGNPADDRFAVRHWGGSSYGLRDGGDVARLITFDDTTVACDAWGRARCP